MDLGTRLQQKESSIPFIPGQRVVHLIIFGAELWQSGTVVPGQSDLEHKNAISVWTPLTEGRFMDMDFTLWATGIWSATMNNKQQTTEKIPLVCNCWDGCSLSHRAGVPST